MTEDGEGEVGHVARPEDLDTPHSRTHCHEEAAQHHGQPQAFVDEPHAGDEERYQHVITCRTQKLH